MKPIRKLGILSLVLASTVLMSSCSTAFSIIRELEKLSSIQESASNNTSESHFIFNTTSTKQTTTTTATTSTQELSTTTVSASNTTTQEVSTSTEVTTNTEATTNPVTTTTVATDPNMITPNQEDIVVGLDYSKHQVPAAKIEDGRSVESDEQHLYWRTLWTGLELDIANLIYKALLEGKTSVDLAPAMAGTKFPDDPIGRIISPIVYTVKDGDPRFFYYVQEFTYEYTYINHGNETWSFPSYVLQFTIKDEYNSQDKVNKAWQAMNNQVWEWAREINQVSDNLLERYALAHRKINQNAYYDEAKNHVVNNPYDAIMNNKTMCVGYALSFQMLANRLGGNAISVYGYAEPENYEGDYHNWNMVKLGDAWYHLDATWDDTSYAGSSYEHDPNALPLHTYFMRGTNKITTHEVYTVKIPNADKDIPGFRKSVSNNTEMVDEIANFFKSVVPDKNKSIGFYLDINYPLTQEQSRELIQEGFKKSGVSYGASWHYTLDLGIFSMQLFPHPGA